MAGVPALHLPGLSVWQVGQDNNDYDGSLAIIITIAGTTWTGGRKSTTSGLAWLDIEIKTDSTFGGIERHFDWPYLITM